jgi:hypothetical protein
VGCPSLGRGVLGVVCVSAPEPPGEEAVPPARWPVTSGLVAPIDFPILSSARRFTTSHAACEETVPPAGRRPGRQLLSREAEADALGHVQPSMPHKESAVKQITVNRPNTRRDYLAGSNSGERDGSVSGRVGTSGATGSLGVSWIGCSSGITLCRRLGSPMSAIGCSLHLILPL